MKRTAVYSLILAVMLFMFSGCSFEHSYRNLNGVLFPVNENGLTYGSAKQIKLPDDYDIKSTDARDVFLSCCPDLISTTAENGAEGYMYKEDMFPEPAPSPEAASTGAYDSSDVDRFVYQSDGKTVIGKG